MSSQNQNWNRSVRRVLRSEIFCGYDSAFRRLTGLPLQVAVEGMTGHALEEDEQGSEFCKELMATSASGRAAMLDAQRSLHSSARESAVSAVSAGGLTETAVPLRNGGELLGWLRTGQVFVGHRRPAEFSEVAGGLGLGSPTARLQSLWIANRMVERDTYAAAVDLLSAFSVLLGDSIGRFFSVGTEADSAQIARAKKFIEENSGAPLRLAEVARVAGMSTNYFSSEFRRATGLTFTDFLALTRVEAAKRRLLNPRERVCETAFEVGFQSLSQFNRTFRKTAGESPSEFRVRHQRGGVREPEMNFSVG